MSSASVEHRSKQLAKEARRKGVHPPNQAQHDPLVDELVRHMTTLEIEALDKAMRALRMSGMKTLDWTCLPWRTAVERILAGAEPWHLCKDEACERCRPHRIVLVSPSEADAADVDWRARTHETAKKSYEEQKARLAELGPGDRIAGESERRESESEVEAAAEPPAPDEAAQPGAEKPGEGAWRNERSRAARGSMGSIRDRIF